MCMFVCERGLDFVKPALLTRSENPTKTLLFGLIVSPVSGICQSSGNTQMRVHPRSHTHTHRQWHLARVVLWFLGAVAVMVGEFTDVPCCHGDELTLNSS